MGRGASHFPDAPTAPRDGRTTRRLVPSLQRISRVGTSRCFGDYANLKRVNFPAKPAFDTVSERTVNLVAGADWMDSTADRHTACALFGSNGLK